jgi:23S rRNA pseudouridine2604 synthase
MTDSTRLAKRIAEQVPCSRREAEQYIEGGWVKVDGRIVEEPGFRVLPQQQAELMPEARLAEVEPVTILLHKPPGHDADAAMKLVTSGTLAPDDRSGLRFLKRHIAGLTLTTPLETEACGLVIFSQDWRIVRKLMDDAARIEQEYIVEVAGELAAEGLALLNHGLVFNGKALPPMKVSWQNETHLRFALKGFQRGLLAHVCDQVGLKVLSTKRLRVGRISMARLPQGQWRYLAGYERF